jgi:hypothetical protein
VARQRLSEYEQSVGDLPLLAQKLDRLIQLQEEAIEIEKKKLKSRRPMSIKEAAEHLGVCPNTLRALKDAGVLKQGVHFLQHRSNYFFRHDFAEKMFAERQDPPQSVSPPPPQEGGSRRSSGKRGARNAAKTTIDPNY